MRLLTWNVYRHNQRVSELLLEARNSSADVVCFQEVAEKHLNLLAEVFQGFHIFKCRQFFLKKRSEHSICLYNIVVSRFPFVNCFAVPHANEGLSLPPRYRFSYSGLELEFAVADIRSQRGEVVRLFNLHLECVAPPSVRLARLSQVHDLFLPNSTNIVMGDFNSFMNPFIAPLLAGLYGNFRADDYQCFEWHAVQSACTTMGLQNPFAGTRSFRYSAGQYDYVLIPEELRYRNKQRLPRLAGSDHFGFCLDVSF